MTIPNHTSVRDALLHGADERMLCLQAMRHEPENRHFVALSEPQQTALLDFAKRNLVEPLVCHSLLIAHGPTADFATRARCTLVYEASDARISTLCQQLDRIAAACAQVGVPIVALKNAGIARALLTHKGTCPMGDVDLLVKKSDFMAAHEVLLELGFALASRSSLYSADLESAMPSGGAEYHATIDDEDVWVELQWRSVAGRWIRDTQEPETDGLIDRSIPIDGSKLRVLEPTDNMLQVCLHTAKHSYVRDPGLRLHTDVDRLAALAPPDWSSFVALAQHADVAHSVYFSLALAHLLLQTPIPGDVLAGLAPPFWKSRIMWKWLARADIFEPQDQKFSRPEMLAFHALLYDDARGLAASALDTNPDELRWRNMGSLASSGARRLSDLTTRYQR